MTSQNRRSYKSNPYPTNEFDHKPEYVRLTEQICKVDGCDRVLNYHAKDGVCRQHVRRMKAHGTYILQGSKVPGMLEIGKTAPKGSVCSVEGCENPGGLRRWANDIILCRPHNTRLRRNGDVQADIPLKEVGGPYRKCSVPGCGRPHSHKGFCAGHHYRWAKYGTAFPKSALKVFKRKNKSSNNR